VADSLLHLALLRNLIVGVLQTIVA